MFKVGDRVRLKHTPSVEWTVATLTDSSQHVVIRKADSGWIVVNVEDLARIDPDPIAPYRRPSEEKSGTAQAIIHELQMAQFPADIQAQAAQQRGHGYLQNWQAYQQAQVSGPPRVIESVNIPKGYVGIISDGKASIVKADDPAVAAAKAKCAETVTRAKAMGIKVGPGFEQGVLEGLSLCDEVNAIFDVNREPVQRLADAKPGDAAGALAKWREEMAGVQAELNRKLDAFAADARNHPGAGYWLNAPEHACTPGVECADPRHVNTALVYDPERARLADECQKLRDENTKLHAQANRDRMLIEQLERQLRGKR